MYITYRLDDKACKTRATLILQLQHWTHGEFSAKNRRHSWINWFFRIGIISVIYVEMTHRPIALVIALHNGNPWFANYQKYMISVPIKFKYIGSKNALESMYMVGIICGTLRADKPTIEFVGETPFPWNKYCILILITCTCFGIYIHQSMVVFFFT